MVRAVEDDVRRAQLLHPAQVEDRDAVRDVAHDAEVVRDEEVRDLLLGLELDEQVEDRGLHGDVEGRRRLVAHDELRVAGECARDRHALLESARELHRLLRQGALGEPDALGELAHPLLRRLPSDPGQLLQRAEQDPLYRMAAVQRRVRVLEHDLERTQVCFRALLIARRQFPAFERRRPRVGGHDPEQRPRHGRLPAPGLADEAERLARPDGDVHVGERVDVVPALPEHLRELFQALRAGLRSGRRRQLEVSRLYARKPLRTLVVPAPALVSRADADKRRLLCVTALVGERAPVGEHAPGELRAEAREEPGIVSSLP